MGRTLTELLTGRNPVELADSVIGVSRAKEPEMEKVAGLADRIANAGYDDPDLVDLGIGADFGGDGLDPETLEKLASAVERVQGALSHIRPDIELESILSMEGRRLLEGVEVTDLEDIPLEKTAGRHGEFGPATKAKVFGELRLRRSGR